MTSNSPVVSEERIHRDQSILERELEMIARQYPAPDWREYARDGAWFASQTLKGGLDSFHGKVVAVFREQVVGAGEDELAMRIQLSEKYRVLFTELIRNDASRYFS